MREGTEACREWGRGKEGGREEIEECKGRAKEGGRGRGKKGRKEIEGCRGRG